MTAVALDIFASGGLAQENRIRITSREVYQSLGRQHFDSTIAKLSTSSLRSSFENEVGVNVSPDLPASIMKRNQGKNSRQVASKDR